MKKLKLIFYSCLLIAFVAAVIFRQGLLDYFGPRLQSIEITAAEVVIKEISKSISAPAPLKKLGTPPVGAAQPALTLTRSGDIKWTNTERTTNGLPVLSENKQLDSIALLRLEDMFENQYFAHVSPTGSKAEKVAGEAGYDYLALGENLALGNFSDDKDLVDAWMGSPGHRANILNTHYTEIGVAVKAGVFEGKPAWIGVQIFGKPASACPKPDETLKARIEAMEIELKNLQATLDAKRAEIGNSDRRAPDYNEKVAAYNALVEQYNTFLSQTKDSISQYNGQVAILNQCIGS